MRRLAIVAALALVGCVTAPRPMPKLVGLPPEGWTPVPAGTRTIYARESAALQRIEVESLATPVAFPNTLRKILEGMTTAEAAAVVLGELAAGHPSFTLLEQRPARVGGLPGFRLVFEFKSGDGLTYRSVLCGALQERAYYAVHFEAPARHYFARDVDAFEKFAADVRLVER